MLYIHIPFCQRRCAYCDFFSTTSLAKMEAYVGALCQEIQCRAGEWPASRVPSLYVGGGTPSLLPTESLRRIVDTVKANYPLDESDAEMTIEVNPDDVTASLLSAVRNAGFNRISMGVQSFHDVLLDAIGRRHTARQALDSVKMMREAGFRNISIDLMYGLPGQTMEMWQTDVGQAISLDVPHISAYSLQWEEGTPLWHRLMRGEVAEAPEELSVEMYSYLMDTLSHAGYEHYEISNFARPGWHSRHNSAYWQGVPYMGFGAGAHGYDGANVRRFNFPSLSEYLASPGNPPFEEECLTEDELLEEMVMTRLRTSAGLNLSVLSARFGEDASRRVLEQAQPHILSGRLVQCGDVLRLAKEGIFVSNDIISDLF